jgi:hypothetical protein
MLRRLTFACVALLALAAPAAAQDSRGPLQVTLSSANACANLDVAGMGRGVWDIRGTFTGTVTFYVSVGGTQVAIDVATPDAPGTAVNSTTAAGAWVGDVAGWRTMIACMTSYTSGSAIVTLSAAATGGGGGGGGSGGGGGESTIADGSSAGVADVIGEAAAGTEQGLVVRCASGCAGAGGTSQADDSAVTNITGIGALYDLTPPAITDGRVGLFRMSTDRYLYTIFPSAQSVTLGAAVPAGTNNIGDVDIASSVTLQVQSNSANLATQTTADEIATDTGALVTATDELEGDLETLAATVSSTRVNINVAAIGGNAPTSELTFDMDSSGGGTQTRTAVGIAIPSSGGAVQAGTDASPFTVAIANNPCDEKEWIPLAISVAADTQLITGSAGVKNHICALTLVAAAAEVVNIVEGTGAVCATGKAAVLGSTTDANGMSLAANGGFALPSRVPGITANVNTCITLGGTSRVSGYLAYVQQ